MKKLAFLLTFMIPLFLSAQTYVFPGPVSGTWDLDGSPYLVTGEISIDKGSSLDIEAGVVVMFTGWYKLIVYGGLNAVGTENSKILFTVNDPKINWNGIRFITPQAGSVLEHCIIEKGLAVLNDYSYPENSGGGLYFFRTQDVSILVKNTIIRDNEAWFGGGVHMAQSNPTFEDCEIINNTAVHGGGLEISEGSLPTINNSLIAMNNAYFGGGIEIIRATPAMVQNTFKNNIARVSGGALYINGSSDYIFRKNIISHNTADEGGAISFVDSDGSFCNNTITFNYAFVRGGALYFDGNSNPEIMNTIIFFNDVFNVSGGKSVYLASDDSDPHFQYCDVEGGLGGFKGSGSGTHFDGEYEGCLQKDPLFKNAANGDYSITWNNYPYPDETMSPCIDAGCPSSLGDPDCTCCDIGAHFYEQIIEVPLAYPSPAQNYAYLYFLTVWSEAYGALEYELDVATDPEFLHCVIKKFKVQGTHHFAYVPHGGQYYYRVRAVNTALNSAYSNTIGVLMNPVSIDENDEAAIRIYNSQNHIVVDISKELKNPGELKVYSLSGQLIAEQRVNSGMNRIELSNPQQIVLVKMLLDGKIYQEKVMIR